jgi:hypothetical protein
MPEPTVAPRIDDLSDPPLGTAMRKNSGRSLNALVCDDVREEVGHKSTLVGVYQGDLTVHDAPTILPKLSFFFRVIARAERPMTRLVVRVLKNGEDFLTADFAEDALPTPDSSEGTYHVQIVLQAQPFEVSGPADLQFLAETEDETLEGGRLVIRVAESGSTTLQ